MQNVIQFFTQLGEVTFSRLENRKRSASITQTEYNFTSWATQCPMQHIDHNRAGRVFDRFTNTCNCNKNYFSRSRRKNKNKINLLPSRNWRLCSSALLNRINWMGVPHFGSIMFRINYLINIKYDELSLCRVCAPETERTNCGQFIYCVTAKNNKTRVRESRPTMMTFSADAMY